MADGSGSLGVADVLITDELTRRPARNPDYEAENRALGLLAQEMANNPRGVLQRCAELVMELCHADSAGISILEPGGASGILRWHAAAGAFAPNLHGTMPSESSPCGTVIERNCVLLFNKAERFFPALRGVEPRIYENLLAPWHAKGEAVGTLWAIKHTPEGRFDAEDARVLKSVARFAAAAFQTISALDQVTAERSALQESEERLRNVLEGMDECFGIMNHELRIITQNKAALAIDGRPLSEIEGHTHSEVYPNADPAIEALYHRALTGGRPVSLEHRYGWQDGRASWLEMRAFPVPEGLAVFWRDISERKLSETRLKESEERFRLVADNISQLAWTCDSLGNVNWYNQRWLDYTGMSFDDMKSWGWEKVQHPEHAERVVAGVKRAAASGEPWEDTFPLRRYDGEYRWFYSRAMPIRDERGDIVQWFGTNTDVTDRFEAEEKLRDSERHQRTLLAELQHRVRNTLAVVRSIARRTAERSGSTEEMISHFEGRLSAFSRIQSVVTRSPERGVDLKSLIEDELLAVTAHDGHILRAKGPAIVLRSRAAESVSLAIHELATNAVKYGALTIASGRIQVRWDRVDDADGARLDLEWLESGLGYAPKPTREGFGHELLKRSLPYELQARTSIEFTDDGLRFTMSMPLSSDMVVGAERND